MVSLSRLIWSSKTAIINLKGALHSLGRHLIKRERSFFMSTQTVFCGTLRNVLLYYFPQFEFILQNSSAPLNVFLMYWTYVPNHSTLDGALVIWFLNLCS